MCCMYVSSNTMITVTDRWRMWRKWVLPVPRYPVICLEGLRKTKKETQNIWPPGNYRMRSRSANHHGRRLFKISSGAQVYVTNPPGRQCQRIENSTDDKECTRKHGERMEWKKCRLSTRLCRSWIPRISIIQTNRPHTTQPAPLPVKNAESGSVMENYKHPTKNVSRAKWLPAYHVD
jgi:hypothetical protein